MSAWRTVRRCTWCRWANSRMLSPSSRCWRRILSNSSTLDNSFSLAPTVWQPRSVGAGARGWGHFWPSLRPLLGPDQAVIPTRQRYGTQTCPAERLRADLLDQAVIDALLETFQQSDLFEQAIAASRAQAAQLHDQHQAELATVTGQIAKAEATIERYLDAFEAGTMSDETCGQRVQKQGAKIAELRVRQTELHAALDAANIQPPTRDELADLAEQVRIAVAQGPTPASGSCTP